MIATVTPPDAPFIARVTPGAQTLPKHISPTAAKAYLSCSLKFYFERAACIKKPTPVALHVGKSVHAALQAFHLARWHGTDHSPEAIAAAYEKAFHDLERDEGTVDFKSAAAKPDPAQAAFDHEIQLVSYQLLLEAAGETPPSLDLVFLVKTKTPQVIRVSSPPADAHRKRRVVALLETAVQGIAAHRHYPQPGMQCPWCPYQAECRAWLPSRPLPQRRAA